MVQVLERKVEVGMDLIGIPGIGCSVVLLKV